MYRYQDLRLRTKKFALDLIHFYRRLPRNTAGYIIGKQLLRAGTSIAANYRAVQRARSKADFIAKLGIFVEKADETQFWLELLEDSHLVRAEEVEGLQREVTELVAVLTASLKTSKG